MELHYVLRKNFNRFKADLQYSNMAKVRKQVMGHELFRHFFERSIAYVGCKCRVFFAFEIWAIFTPTRGMTVNSEHRIPSSLSGFPSSHGF